MSFGSCLGVMLLLLWWRVTNAIDFYLIWVGLGVASAMLFHEPAFAATATWFTTLRRHALTIVTVGGALASVVFVPVATWLVLQLGWRGAVFAWALIFAIVTIPLHVGVLRRQYHHPRVLAAPRGRSAAHVLPHAAAPAGAARVPSNVQRRTLLGQERTLTRPQHEGRSLVSFTGREVMTARVMRLREDCCLVAMHYRGRVAASAQTWHHPSYLCVSTRSLQSEPIHSSHNKVVEYGVTPLHELVSSSWPTSDDTRHRAAPTSR